MGEFMPYHVTRPDPQVEHLKVMAAIMRQIERLTVGKEITVMPNAAGGWTIKMTRNEDIYNVDKALDHIPPAPPEPVAAKLIEREIEERTGNRILD